MQVQVVSSFELFGELTPGADSSVANEESRCCAALFRPFATTRGTLVPELETPTNSTANLVRQVERLLKGQQRDEYLAD